MNLTISNSNDYEEAKSKIRQIITDYGIKNNVSIDQSTIEQLAVHLAIALIRIESNSYIPLSSSILNTYKNNEIYIHAKNICDNISKEFDLEIVENEIAFVAMRLLNENLFETEFFSGLDIIEEDIINISKKAIEHIYQKYQVDFRKDEKLLASMSLHLLPAVDRLLRDEFSKNPLKKEIMERHQREFSFAEVLNEVVERMYQKSFNNDELAFLTLYFVLATNRLKNYDA